MQRLLFTILLPEERRTSIMKEKYQKLFQPIELRNGVTINGRYALSSIVTNSSTAEGRITEDDINYHDRHLIPPRFKYPEQPI